MEIKAEALRRAKKIKLVIFDVDGVMTDGGIYVGPEGELYKPFNCKDGLGITLAHRSGLRTAIITGRESKQLAYRAGELHITEVMQGHRNKRGAYKELKERQNLTDEEIAYVGDDLIDLPVMLQVGLPLWQKSGIALWWCPARRAAMELFGSSWNSSSRLRESGRLLSLPLQM